jgi:hypothetical protein
VLALIGKRRQCACLWGNKGRRNSRAC